MLMSKNVNNDVSKDSPMELPFVRSEKRLTTILGRSLQVSEAAFEYFDNCKKNLKCMKPG